MLSTIKLASYHNKVAAILNFFTVERLFNFNSISILTSEQSFFFFFIPCAHFTSGNMCPTLRVWGVPIWFSTLARFWNERHVLHVFF